MDEKSIENAIKEAISGGKKRNFRQSIEISINLKDVDMSLPKNRIDEKVILPHGRGQDARIGVFANGELAVKSKGIADLVIEGNELAEKAEDKRDARKIANSVDFFIAEAPLMPNIGRYWGIFLGPRGKMPTPLPPAADPNPIIENLRKTIKIRSKDKKTFHALVGKEDMNVEDIARNILEVIKRIETKLERGPNNIKSVYVKTTMGPSVKLR